METPTRNDLDTEANPGNILIGIATGYVVLLFVAVYGGHWWQMRKIRKKREKEKGAKL